MASFHHPLTSPLIHINPPLSPKSRPNPICHQYYREGIKRMQFTKNKLIPVLVFILSSISILRLLKISIVVTSSSSSVLPSIFPGFVLNSTNHHQRMFSYNTTKLTAKEFGFLSSVISQKSPCNLLVFGFQPQYLKLVSINGEGYTVFLEDDPAKDAYKMLKHARKDPTCAPNSRMPKESTCRLALKKLPTQVYETKWDVVVVDGPRGDTLESPGRMGAIYTAGILSRDGNVTDVIVHDVDRTVEKWFSWEFLCDKNLVSTKGRLWNFRIMGRPNSTSFC